MNGPSLFEKSVVGRILTFSTVQVFYIIANSDISITSQGKLYQEVAILILFSRLENMSYFNMLLVYLAEEDAKNFKQDLESVRQYRSKNA